MGKTSNKIKEMKNQFEAQLLEYGKEFTSLLDDGYSEGQIYNKYPKEALEEIGIMNKTSFTRTLRRILKKYKMRVAEAAIE